VREIRICTCLHRDDWRQEIAVFIFGPTFVPGAAQASATLFCGELLSGLDLGRTINIVE